jgi:hypothetical protein
MEYSLPNPGYAKAQFVKNHRQGKSHAQLLGIFSVHMSPKSHLKFWNPRTTFEFPPLCLEKYCIVLEEGGVQEMFLKVES